MKRIQTRQILVQVLLLFFCVVMTRAGENVPWGDNLFTNGSFEAGNAGWTAVARPGNRPVDALSLVDGCSGKSALRIASPSEGGTLMSPVVHLEPGWYVFSFWYRFELREDHQPHQLVYVNRQTGLEAQRRRDSLYFYYNHPVVDGNWYLTFLTFRLQEGDTGLQLGFAVGGDTVGLAVDAVQIRRLASLEGSGEIMTVETRAYGADHVADPRASNGYAWRVVEGKQQRGGKTGGSTRFTSPPGLYRVTYRFCQEEPGDGVVLGLRVSGDAGSALREVRAEEFVGEGYQTFSLYWLYPFGTGCFPAWDWKGSGTYRYGSVTLERLQSLGYRQCWDMLAGDADVAKVLPTAAPLPEGTRAWVAAGLYTKEAGILDALKEAEMPFVRSYLVTQRGGGMGLDPELPDLKEIEIVVISNIPTRALDPSAQLTLRHFVESGGTLLVLGGFYAYGHGGYGGSFLEELLPVQIKRTFDLTAVKGTLTGECLPLRQGGGCAWVHDVKVKPGAEILCRIGGHPGIVSWTVGQGRVVAVTVTVLGDPDEPFWENPEWTRVLVGLMTGHRDGHDVAPTPDGLSGISNK